MTKFFTPSSRPSNISDSVEPAENGEPQNFPDWIQAVVTESSVIAPQKILLTHERFSPDFGGGGAYIVLRAAQTLQAAGHEIRVLCCGDPSITEVEGVRTLRTMLPRHAFAALYHRIRQEARNADLVLTFNYHAALPTLWAARSAGVPVMCTMLGLFGRAWRDLKGPVLGRLYEALERRILRAPYDRTLFLSDYSRTPDCAWVRARRAVAKSNRVSSQCSSIRHSGCRARACCSSANSRNERAFRSC